MFHSVLQPLHQQTVQQPNSTILNGNYVNLPYSNSQPQQPAGNAFHNGSGTSNPENSAGANNAIASQASPTVMQNDGANGGNAAAPNITQDNGVTSAEGHASEELLSQIGLS